MSLCFVEQKCRLVMIVLLGVATELIGTSLLPHMILLLS